MSLRPAVPTVLWCQTAWLKACAETKKFFALGLTHKTKAPWEAALTGLAYLRLLPGVYKSPLELVELEDIQHIILTHVFFPDDRFKDYSSGSAKYKTGVNANINAILSPVLARHPLLTVCFKIHSHPLGGDSLSPTDICTIFKSYAWFRNKGLNTVFTGLMSSNWQNWPQPAGWQINCFALNAWGINISLPVRFVSRQHAFIRESRQLPYYLTALGRAWDQHNRHWLQNNHFDFSINVLSRGWRRYTLNLPRGKFVVCLPPFFPWQTARILRVVRNYLEPFRLISLPRQLIWQRPGNNLKDYQLSELIAAVAEEI